MKKLLIFLILMAVTVSAGATDRSKIELRGSGNDEQTTLMDTGLIVKTFNSSVRQSNKVSLDASSTTSITVPTGAKVVLIDVGSYEGLHISGESGDKGISLDDTVPLLMPLSADGNTTIVISNDIGSSATIILYWF